jgi:hypothetical protein
MGKRLMGVGAAAVLVSAVVAGLGPSPVAAKSLPPQVLYVGSFNGVSTPPSSTFSTIQGAVNAAHKGDYILIAPGDYHETGDMGQYAPSPSEVQEGWYGGVDITTSDIHLRGMNRNGVIVDGTLASATTPCSSAAGDQNPLGGKGRNGIVVWKAKSVTIDNLTVCNFIAGSGSAGNEIWWNGGSGSGKVGIKGYQGSYLTATSTYFVADPGSVNVCSTCALYGIFASNAENGTLNQLYANNFSDSGMYVGACHRVCAATITNAWMENNALGYSGTNSGGKIVIENSKFDNNKDGLDTNTALTGDPPPPQDGRCPGNTASPVTLAGMSRACWVFTQNLVENNNNPNVPIAGTAGLGPTGTGMTISGGRFDTVLDNQFLNNGAWGVLFAPYPDGNSSSAGKTCKSTGGTLATGLGIAGVSCLFDPEGDSLINNEFSGNGTFGNPSNGDFGNLLISGHEPENCFLGNTRWDSTFTTQSGPAVSGNSNPMLNPACPSGTRTAKTGLLGSNTDVTMLTQAECDAGVLTGCTGTNYPKPTAVVMQPLPTLPSMTNPCVGVPENVWCPNGVPAP